MSRADEIARKALSIRTLTSVQIDDLAPVVAAALRDYAKEERERCAQIAESFTRSPNGVRAKWVAREIAARIREGTQD